MNDPFEKMNEPERPKPSGKYQLVTVLAAVTMLATLPVTAVVWVWTTAAWGVTVFSAGFLLTFLFAALAAAIKGDLGR